jgi:sulfur carrier protein
MNVKVNGDQVVVPDDATVRSVVEMMAVTPSSKGIAVALNAEVIHRSAWDTTTLSEADQVEVLSAIGGG